MLTVSVIIPTINRPFLLEAVKSCQDQTVLPLEILINFEKGNVAEILNKMISQSKGDAFVLLPDDDLLKPQYIEKTSLVMEKESTDIVATALENFGLEQGVHIPGAFPFGTALFRKSIWEKVGGYDPLIGPASDADFGLMCQEAGAKRITLEEPLFNFRLHNSNWSKTADWESGKERFHSKHPRS